MERFIISIMKHLKKFKTSEELNNESYKFPYPCVAMSTDGQGNQDVHFEPEQSWVKCKYSIPDDVFDENGYVDLMLGARGYIKSYKVSGKYAEIEPEQRIEGVATEVFGEITIEGTTGYAPLFEHCPEATTITSEMTFTLSRTVQPTDYVFMCAYDGEGVLQMFQPAGTVQELISAGSYDMYFTFLDDTHYRYGDALIAMIPEMAGFHLFFGFVDPEYFAANALQMPTLKTYTQSVQILGGIQNIGVNKSDLDENGECEIEYQMVYWDVPDSYGYVSHIDSRFNSSVLKEIDLKNITKSGWTGIKPGTFHNNESLTKFIAGDKLDFRDRVNMFKYCPNLTEIVIENNDLWEVRYNAIVFKESNTMYSTCASTTYINTNNVNLYYLAFENNTGIYHLTLEGATVSTGNLTTSTIKKLTIKASDAFSLWNSDLSKIEHLCLIDSTYDSRTSLSNLKTLELTNVSFTVEDKYDTTGGAFRNNTSLTDVIIHEMCTRTDGTYPTWTYVRHFAGCTNLQNVICTGEVFRCLTKFAFKGTPFIDNFEASGDDCLIVNNVLLYANSNVTESFTVPDNIKYITERALINTTITELDTNCVEKIGLNVTPATLLNLHIGRNLNAAVKGTFTLSPNIETITVDEDNSKYSAINNSLFSSNSFLVLGCKNSVLPTNFNYSINSYAFYQRASGSIVIPDNVTLLDSSAFWGCTELTDVTIGSNITEIGEYAFSQCTNLQTVTFSENSVLTKISKSAFHTNTSLTNIILPDSVEYIGEYAFYNCVNIESVILPESITLIGYEAFRKCTNLNSVYIKATIPPTVSFSAFYGNAYGRKIYVPMESVDVYKTASDSWEELADYIVGYNFE